MRANSWNESLKIQLRFGRCGFEKSKTNLDFKVRGGRCTKTVHFYIRCAIEWLLATYSTKYMFSPLFEYVEKNTNH